MPLVPTEGLVTAAASRGTAILAFNVVTLEHAEAVAAGAEAAGQPAILQLSHNAVRFHGGLRPIAAAAAAIARASTTQLSLHLDHVEDMTLLREARPAGFSSAMFDAGVLPYAKNVAATRAAVVWAHKHGLWLEAELGHVGGKSSEPVSAHEPGARTDPDEAAAFVSSTRVDALAVAVGSSHAMSSRTAVLDRALIRRLRERVSVPLVLHGSSGVPDDEMRAAIDAGIVKVNIGTALNIAYTTAVDSALRRSTATDPRTYLAAAREGMAGIVQDRLSAVSAPRS